MGLKLKHGTAASATSANPVLEVGEIGYESDTGKWKFGDGITAWNSLAYQPSSGSSGDFSTSVSTSVASEFVLFDGTTGKLGKRATGTGYVKATSGVMSTQSTPIPVADGGSGAATLASGGVLKGHGTSAVTADATINDLGAQTADYSANSHKITSLTDPTSAQDASTKNYTDTTRTTQHVRVVAIINMAVASAVVNGATIDSVTIATGERVLLTGQSTASQNGVYIVASSGAASRAGDAIVAGTTFNVNEGTVYHDTKWHVTTDDPITLGSTSLTIAQFAPVDPAAATAGQRTLGFGSAQAKQGNSPGSTIPMVFSGGTNQYWFTEIGNAATQALTLNRAYFMPILFPSAVTLGAFQFEVTTGGSAGSVVRGGLFNATAAMLPGTLVADYGTVATTGTGNMTFSPAASLSGGTLYFLALASQVALCTVRCRNTNNALIVQTGTTPSLNGLLTSHFASGISGSFSSSPTIAGQTQGPTCVVSLT